ncbi:Polynucleotidyl transferase ribonuclease H-like superfamily protein [Euphorbia peplus]|nr:Polynucleotidyl transferase ribonuclease H-like superfamily protein [Euphorbia peplus]
MVAAHQLMCNVSSLLPRTIWIAWKPPELGWVKLNTDGACKGNPGFASAGGLIRDCNGKWCGGFGVNIGFCTSSLAELWGVYFGLRLAWDKGYRKVIVEMDSKVVMNWITNPTDVHHPFSWLIERCLHFKDNEWDIRVIHSYREGNRAVDWLTNFAGSCPLGYHEFGVPPAGLQVILTEDFFGFVRSRIVCF